MTVTDPEMTRYFMTIPEAVQLVIQAGDLGAGAGEVFVLEMGEPVKIIELARNMIRLAGYEPDADIPIEIIGVRPGEKLHEELFNPDERPQQTTADRIVRAVRAEPLDPDWVEETVERLRDAGRLRRRGGARRARGRADGRRGHGAPHAGLIGKTPRLNL